MPISISKKLAASVTKTTAEELADREGLHGAARLIFLQELRDVFGFRTATPQPQTWRLVVLALAIGGLGTALEMHSGQGIAGALVWLGIAGTGLVVATLSAWRGARTTALNRELEWRAYCLLIRPMVLRLRPGLLDRNLEADHGAIDSQSCNSGPATLAGFRVDRWRTPAVVGWTAGAVLAVVWRFASGSAAWLGYLAAGGAIIGPLVWAVFRWTVFRHLHRVVHGDERK